MTSSPPAAATPSLPETFLLNPYLHITLGALFITASELLLKTGAAHPTQIAAIPAWLGLGALASCWTWAGILTYILSFLCWLIVLKRLALSLAFCLISVVHVLVPIAAWLILHEQISPQRWLGIALVTAGILIIAQPATQAEARL